jgi:hypothetical protein
MVDVAGMKLAVMFIWHWMSDMNVPRYSIVLVLSGNTEVIHLADKWDEQVLRIWIGETVSHEEASAAPHR